MNCKEQQLKGQFEECNKKFVEVIERAKADFGAAASQQGGWQQGPSDRPARGLIDLKDQKIDKMPESMLTEVLRKWKQDLMKHLDNIPSWRRGSHILEETGVHPSKMDADQMDIVLKKINDTEAGRIVSGLDWVQTSWASTATSSR